MQFSVLPRPAGGEALTGGEGAAAAWKRPSPWPSLAPLRGRSVLRASLTRERGQKGKLHGPDKGVVWAVEDVREVATCPVLARHSRTPLGEAASQIQRLRPGVQCLPAKSRGPQSGIVGGSLCTHLGETPAAAMACLSAALAVCIACAGALASNATSSRAGGSLLCQSSLRGTCASPTGGLWLPQAARVSCVCAPSRGTVLLGLPPWRVAEQCLVVVKGYPACLHVRFDPESSLSG
jgi:hypothetical protein